MIDVDGHDLGAITAAFDEARTVKGRPTCIIAKTFMGAGVSFMQDKFEWHGKTPNADQATQSLEELAK